MLKSTSPLTVLFLSSPHVVGRAYFAVTPCPSFLPLTQNVCLFACLFAMRERENEQLEINFYISLDNATYRVFM